MAVTATSVPRVRAGGAFEAAVHVLSWPEIRDRALPTVDVAREEIDWPALRSRRWRPNEQVLVETAEALERGEAGPTLSELTRLSRAELGWVLNALALLDHRFAGLTVVPPDGFGSEVTDERAAAAERVLGPRGRLITGSEISYRHELPDHVPVFGCSVCVADGRLWHGDLDLTVDEERLKLLAHELAEAIYVLCERYTHLRHEERPILELASYVAGPDGSVDFDVRQFERTPDGTLRQRPSPWAA